MKNTKAFTLIELLVVVLIIGILTAIALPQYEKAIEKSKATEAFLGLRAIGQAEKIYFLENGTYASSFDLLDVDIPGKSSLKAWNFNPYDAKPNQNWSFQFYTDYRTISVNALRISGPYKGAAFVYKILYTGGNDVNAIGLGEITCRELPGYVFKKNPGDFCEKIFQGTIFDETESLRSYTIP